MSYNTMNDPIKQERKGNISYSLDVIVVSLPEIQYVHNQSLALYEVLLLVFAFSLEYILQVVS